MVKFFCANNLQMSQTLTVSAPEGYELWEIESHEEALEDGLFDEALFDLFSNLSRNG